MLDPDERCFVARQMKGLPTSVRRGSSKELDDATCPIGSGAALRAVYAERGIIARPCVESVVPSPDRVPQLHEHVANDARRRDSTANARGLTNGSVPQADYVGLGSTVGAKKDPAPTSGDSSIAAGRRRSNDSA